MKKSKTSDEALYRLIRQSIDDAMFHLGSALSITEMRGSVAADTISRIEHAMCQYEEAVVEFHDQFDELNHRQRSLIQGDFDMMRKKLWVVMVAVSRMAKSNPVLYNCLRETRLKFVVLGRTENQETLAAEAL